MNILRLIGAKRALQNHLDEKMNPSVAYKMMKIIRAANSEETFYKKELQRIIELYGKRNDDGSIATTEDGDVLLCDDSVKECRQMIDSLESIDVEAPNVLFTIEELSCMSITVREMDAIAEFVSESE